LHTPLTTSTGLVATKRDAKELLCTPELERSWCLCLYLSGRARVPELPELPTLLEGHS
jgi:hypothetical protein